MTIREAITQADESLGNTYTQKEKINWLSLLDQRVKTKIIDTHAGADAVSFSGYDASTDLETVLLVPAPFDEMYLRWLEAQIHYRDHEDVRYNNAIDIFNMLWDEFRNDYNSKHMPLGHRFQF